MNLSDHQVGLETQIFVASTVYGLATLAAALDDDVFSAAKRRVLVLSNNTANPETSNPLEDVEGFDLLVKRFDTVFSYNEAVSPQHPSEWMPRGVDIPIWDRHFRQLWDLDDDHVRLVVESIHVRPAAALCQIFHDVEIDVYADGLMSYGPTRSPLPTLVGTRLGRLLHLDLVPGLKPLLLSEWDVQTEIIRASAFRSVLAEISAHVLSPTANEEPVALLLGQYMSALGIVTEDEEADLHLQMLRGVVRMGHRKVIFKPHPTAGRDLADPMIIEARSLGIELTVWNDPMLAETMYERLPIAIVVGCFSTALLTAVSCYGIPVARVGTDLLLERLKPYENSNRIPVMLCDALLPDLSQGTVAGIPLSISTHRVAQQVSPLVTAVGYAMQPKIYPDLRDEAEAFLATNYPTSARYFKRKRLTTLKLPGALPAKPEVRSLRSWAKSKVRAVFRRARRLLRSHPAVRRYAETPDQHRDLRRSPNS